MSFFDGAKTITLAGKAVAKLELAGKKIWEAIRYKNWVKYSTESDLKTIYNGGLGYKNGYRVRSGGQEGESAYGTCTGFIPCKAGQVLRIYHPSQYAFAERQAASINVCDSSGANLGQLAMNGKYGVFSTWGYTWANNVADVNGVKTITIPTSLTDANKIAFVRITVGFSELQYVDGSSLIVTVDEEIA